MKVAIRSAVAALGVCAFGLADAAGQGSFAKKLAPVKVGPIKPTSPLRVPLAALGPDMATLYANGALKTAKGSIFGKLGLSCRLVRADDFLQAVRDYVSGRTPLLRGTFGMMAMASEVIGADPRTRGVVILLMGSAAGDCLIARKRVRSVKDLKGRTVVLAEHGRHVGLLDAVLRSARLKWADVDVEWAQGAPGARDSPAGVFRARKKVAACFVNTSDMVALTGLDQEAVGDRTRAVAGAHVVVSAAMLEHLVADVLVCRRDFYEANRPLVAGFVAGYLKACEELDDLVKQYRSAKPDPKAKARYLELLKLTREAYGKELIPVLAVAQRLLLECEFAGYARNVLFFREKDSPVGFGAFQEKALALAAGRGYVKAGKPLLPSALDYRSAVFTEYLAHTTLPPAVGETPRLDPEDDQPLEKTPPWKRIAGAWKQAEKIASSKTARESLAPAARSRLLSALTGAVRDVSRLEADGLLSAGEADLLRRDLRLLRRGLSLEGPIPIPPAEVSFTRLPGRIELLEELARQPRLHGEVVAMVLKTVEKDIATLGREELLARLPESDRPRARKRRARARACVEKIKARLRKPQPKRD